MQAPTYEMPEPTQDWTPRKSRMWLKNPPAEGSWSPVGAGADDEAPPGWVFPVQGYNGQVQAHWGQATGGADIFAPMGTPVVAAMGGRVISASSDGIGGNNVLIQGTDGNQYYYAHFRDAPLVRPGQLITAGTPLGVVGTSGNAAGTPPHLHFGAGPSIVNGGGATGGTGGNFDALTPLRTALGRPPTVDELRSMASSGRTMDSSVQAASAPVPPLPGPAASSEVRTRALNDIRDAAIRAGLGEEGARVAMAIAVTEGGLTGAVGDPRDRGSYGAFQFNRGQGQLPAFARSQGMSEDQAATLLTQNPMAGVDWALTGYLGEAIKKGMAENRTGPDLATYAQQYGQISREPQRAGATYRQLFQNGSGDAQLYTSPQPAPQNLPPTPPPTIGEAGWTPPMEWDRASRGYQHAFGTMSDDALKQRIGNPANQGDRDWMESAFGMARAGEQFTGEMDWGNAGSRYAQDFGEPFNWDDYENDDESYQYIESALGMSRAGELDWQDEDYNPFRDDEVGGGQDVGVGAGWWGDEDPWQWSYDVPVLGGAVRGLQAIGGATFGAAPPTLQQNSPYDDQRLRQQIQQDNNWDLGRGARELWQNATEGQNPAYDVPVVGGLARAGGLAANTALDLANLTYRGVEYVGGALGGAGQLLVDPQNPGSAREYDYGALGGKRRVPTPQSWEDVFDPAQAVARTEVGTSPVFQLGLGMVLPTGVGKLLGAAKGLMEVAEEGRMAKAIDRFIDVPDAMGRWEDVGRALSTNMARNVTRMSPLVGGIAGGLGGNPINEDKGSFEDRIGGAGLGVLVGLAGWGAASSAATAFQRGARDFRILHYGSEAINDVEIAAIKAQKAGEVLTLDQKGAVLSMNQRADEQRMLIESRWPGFDKMSPQLQSEIRSDITGELARYKLPFDRALEGKPTTDDYPYVQQALVSMAKDFVDKYAVVGDIAGSLRTVYRMTNNAELPATQDPEKLIRRWATIPAQASRWEQEEVRRALKDSGIKFDNRLMAGDWDGLYRAEAAFSRAIGDVPDLFDATGQLVHPIFDQAGNLVRTKREAVRDMASRAVAGEDLSEAGYFPTMVSDPDGFKASGQYAQSIADATERLFARIEKANSYGPGTAETWLENIHKLDDRRAEVILKGLEDSRILAPGDVQRMIDEHGVYASVQVLGKGVDESRKMLPSHQMLDHNVVGREYSATDLIKMDLETALTHDENLIAAAEHNRVFVAFRDARTNSALPTEAMQMGGRVDETDWGKRFMVPMKKPAMTPEGTPLVDELGNAVMEFMKPGDALENLPKGGGWGIYTGRYDGVQEVYRVPQELADTLTTVTPNAANRFLEVAGRSTLSNIFRLGVTTASVPFIFANSFRDFQAAFQNSGTTGLFLRNYHTALFDSFTHGIDKFMAENAEHPAVQGLPGEVYRRIANGIPSLGGTGSVKTGRESVSEAIMQGGGSTLTETLQGMSAQQGIRADPFDVLGFKPEGYKGSALYRILKTPLDLVQAGAFASETATRTAVYRAALQSGKSELEAGLAYQNVTVDFSRGGEFFKTFGMLMPLVNARLQGTLRSAQAFQDDPEGYAHRLTIGAALPAAALYAYNRMMYSDLYDDVPQNDRDRNFIIGYGSITDDKDPTGKTRLLYYKIPKSEITALVANPLEALLDTVYHVKHGTTDLKDTQRTERTAGQMWLSQLAQMMPVTQNANTLGDGQTWLASTLDMNPLVGTLVQMAANKDDFLDRPIVADEEMVLPAEFRRGPNGKQAPVAARAAAALARKIGVPVDIAPPQIAFAVSHLGGTAGSTLLNAPDLVWKAFADAGFPLPAFTPTTLDDLKVPPGADPTAYRTYLDAIDQVDYRPWQVQAASRFFGMGGSAQTTTAKVNQLSLGEKHVWQETMAVSREKDLARAEANEKIQAIYNDPSMDLSYDERNNAISEIRTRLNGRYEEMYAQHPQALKDPATRAAFVANLPGVPIDVGKERPSSLDPSIDVNMLVQRYQAAATLVPGLSPIAQSQARSAELNRMAREFNVPQSTLRDYIAAAQLDNKIPSIPVPSVYLDKIVDNYIQPPGSKDKANPNGYDRNNPEELYAARRAVIDTAVGEWNKGGDPIAFKRDLLERVQTRMVSAQDTNPLALSREKALQLYSRTKSMPEFVNPADGKPLGVPEEWPGWAAELEKWQATQKNKALWPVYVRGYAEAQANARVLQQGVLYADPAYNDYEAWFGFGRSMSPQTYARYISGEMPRYKDSPDNAESARRDGIIRQYNTLPAGPQKNMMRAQAQMFKRLAVPGWEAVARYDDRGAPVGDYDDIY